MRHILLSFTFLLLFSFVQAKDYKRNPHVDKAIWDELSPYFLPYEHPIRPKLDKIFTKSRAIENEHSMQKAGFVNTKPRQHTHVVVSKHPDLSGYIIKAHLDDQKYRYGKPEYFFWKLRIDGAQVIQKKIDDNNLGHLFKVPKKWIYPLPEKPSPKIARQRKNFILIVENVHIHKNNAQMWKKSPKINKENLNTLYWFLSDLGLWDCCKIANIPYTRDGYIAFVDTENCAPLASKIF